MSSKKHPFLVSRENNLRGPNTENLTRQAAKGIFRIAIGLMGKGLSMAGAAKKILPCVCDPGGRLKRMPLATLKRFQGNLKELRSEQYEKLKASMELKGFFAPVFIWAGHEWVLDGHQRLNVLEREGWAVEGGIPVVEIEASDEKDAAEKLLLLSSTYGKIEPQGLYEFTSEHEIDLREFELPDLPDFDVEAFKVEFYEGGASDYQEGKAQADGKGVDCECPMCGHRFKLKQAEIV